MNQANEHRLDTKTGQDQKLAGKATTVIPGRELPPTGPREMSMDEVGEYSRNKDAEVERRASALATPVMGQSSLSLPSESEFASMMAQAQAFVESGLMPPSIQNAAAAVVMIQKGRELRVPPMQAMTSIHVIKGKPAISAELMLALIYRDSPQSDIVFKELTRERCVIHARRKPTDPWQEFSFDQQDVQLAGLGGNHNTYPRAMKKARAITEMARTMFPDIIMGCSYTPEELGANLDIDGNVIDADVVTDQPANISDRSKPSVPPPASTGGPGPINHNQGQEKKKEEVQGNPDGDPGFSKSFYESLLQQMQMAENSDRIKAIGKEIKENADKLLPNHIVLLRKEAEARILELDRMTNQTGGQQQ